MKGIILLLIIVPILYCSAQDPAESISYMKSFGPFKEDSSFVSCGRTWMMPEKRMDSLKREILELERLLSKMTEDSIIAESLIYCQLYDTEFITRIEAGGEINKQYCVTDTNIGDKFGLADYGFSGYKGIDYQVQSFENKYLVVSMCDYYLGNCQKLTTRKIYFIRE